MQVPTLIEGNYFWDIIIINVLFHCCTCCHLMRKICEHVLPMAFEYKATASKYFPSLYFSFPKSLYLSASALILHYQVRHLNRQQITLDSVQPYCLLGISATTTEESSTRLFHCLSLPQSSTHQTQSIDF